MQNTIQSLFGRYQRWAFENSTNFWDIHFAFTCGWDYSSALTPDQILLKQKMVPIFKETILQINDVQDLWPYYFTVFNKELGPKVLTKITNLSNDLAINAQTNDQIWIVFTKIALDCLRGPQLVSTGPELLTRLVDLETQQVFCDKLEDRIGDHKDGIVNLWRVYSNSAQLPGLQKEIVKVLAIKEHFSWLADIYYLGKDDSAVVEIIRQRFISEHEREINRPFTDYLGNLDVYTQLMTIARLALNFSTHELREKITAQINAKIVDYYQSVTTSRPTEIVSAIYGASSASRLSFSLETQYELIVANLMQKLDRALHEQGY